MSPQITRRTLLRRAGAVTAGSAVWEPAIAGGVASGRATSNAARTAQSSSDWAQFQGDAGNTGHRQAASGPTANPTEKWAFTMFGRVTVATDPVLADGAIIAGSNDGSVYAVEASDGSQRWAFDTGQKVWGTPAVAEGVVVTGHQGQTVFGIDVADGSQVWKRTDVTASQMRVAVRDGLAYLQTGDGLGAVDVKTGKTIWSQRVPGKSSVAIADGTVFWGDGGAAPDDGGTPRVFAFDATDGSSVWQTRIGGNVTKRCALTAAGGHVLVGTNDGTLYALDAASGEEAWNFSVGDTVLSSPAVADGRVFVGSGHFEEPTSGRHVWALSLDDGSEVWSYDAGARVLSSPAVADGAVYVSDHNGMLYAFDAANGEMIWRYGFEKSADASPIVHGGVVYTVTRDGIVHAVEEGSGSSGSGNQPPSARMRWQPENPAVGETVQFDGTASSDPDGEIRKYSWKFRGPEREYSASGPQVEQAFRNAGKHAVKLTVTDNDAAEHSNKRPIQIGESTGGGSSADGTSGGGSTPDDGGPRQRGFLTNEGGGPDALENVFNLTVLGFLLSIAGIIHQMIGGR